MIHLHLDSLGGLAGDMFAACVLAAFPEYERRVVRDVALASGVDCRLVVHDDGVLAGSRFEVLGPGATPLNAPLPIHTDDHDHYAGHHRHEDSADHPNGHRAWAVIRAQLQSCGLPTAVRDHAIGIFSVLAEAEARVHGRPVEAVIFHEVGAIDSIADIVAAAVLIDITGATGWSVSALPLGSGRVRTAHGPMPVPAPATALLLEGFEIFEDGIDGERVTPTGAAILAYLRQVGLLSVRPAGHLRASGIGFGTRQLPGISNCVRLLVIDSQATSATSATLSRTLAVVSFDIDDQSGEDLAAGLDRVRAVSGVQDVVQMTAVGKKGRMAIHVQVLADPDALAAVTEACFRETTTIGLRTHMVRGQVLHRRTERTDVDGTSLAVKLVRRPDGETGKAEADHVLGLAGHAVRDERRRRAVDQVLKKVALDDA